MDVHQSILPLLLLLLHLHLLLIHLSNLLFLLEDRQDFIEGSDEGFVGGNIIVRNGDRKKPKRKEKEGSEGDTRCEKEKIGKTQVLIGEEQNQKREE